MHTTILGSEDPLDLATVIPLAASKGICVRPIFIPFCFRDKSRVILSMGVQVAE